MVGVPVREVEPIDGFAEASAYARNAVAYGARNWPSTSTRQLRLSTMCVAFAMLVPVNDETNVWRRTSPAVRTTILTGSDT